MDTSKNYVLMCDKAKEIQDKWAWQFNPIGDYCWLGHDYLGCAVQVITKLFLQLDGRIWLPRQDQLQEMIDLKEGDIPFILQKFINWAGLTYKVIDVWEPSNYAEFRSMEQLWLAFVMKEKYNKVWNGEDWVKK